MTDEKSGIKNKEAKNKDKANIIITSVNPMFDAAFEALALKYIEGASFRSVASELKGLDITAEIKQALFKASIIAAIGSRRTVQDATSKESAIVAGLKGFSIDNVVTMSKLTIIGHSLLRSDISGQIGVAWRSRIGGAKSIFETSDYVQISEARSRIFSRLRARRIFDEESAEAIVKYFSS